MLQKKCQKKKESPFHFLANPVKVKTNAPKKQTISIPDLLQAQPALALQLLAYYCGSSTMLQTEWQLCRPYSDRFLGRRLITVCTVCSADLSEKLRIFTVDILTWIVLMYFHRNKNSILFQQINTE